MQVQTTSFKSTMPNSYNRQNVGSNRVIQQFSGVEPENKSPKENKLLKYVLIGAGTLGAVITAINYKKIGSLFNHKSPLVPVEDILKKAKAESTFIEKSQGKGYQLWHFTSGDFLDEFTKAHDDLSKFVEKHKAKKCILSDVKFIQEHSNDKYVIDFVNLVKEKTGVNLFDKIKHYRFIGQSELDAIRSKTPVVNKGYHGYSYVTQCPDFGLSCPTFDYRITYKNTDNVVKNLDHYHDTQFKSGIKKPYTREDVEKVEKLVDGKWEAVEF